MQAPSTTPSGSPHTIVHVPGPCMCVLWLLPSPSFNQSPPSPSNSICFKTIKVFLFFLNYCWRTVVSIFPPPLPPVPPCWEIWTATCKKRKLDHQLTPYTKTNSRWIKDLNISCDTIKVLEENISRKISDVLHSNIFADVDPRARDTKEKINKWNYINP